MSPRPHPRPRLSIAEMGRMGMDRLREKAADRDLHPRDCWTMMLGGLKFTAAALRGDVVDDETADARATTCAAGCTRSEHGRSEHFGMDQAWCMECKCLVAVLIDGKPTGAAKTMVASERCPLGKWGAEPVRSRTTAPDRTSSAEKPG